MASSARCNGGGVEENAAELTEQTKPRKEGERILAPTRSLMVPSENRFELGLDTSPKKKSPFTSPKAPSLRRRRRQMRKELGSLREVPPGYDPVTEAPPKSKSGKRNERKKEKRQQATIEKGKTFEENEISSSEDSNNVPEPVESVASHMNDLSISAIPSVVAPPSDTAEHSTPVDHVQDIDKNIRALKKKVRQTEAQQQKIMDKNLNPQQLEKVSKLEGWREELKLLKYNKAEVAISSC